MCCLGCCSSDDTTHQDLALNKGKRSCTDVGFLLIFILFCSGLATTTWYAFSRGDPYRIMFGSDSFGNTCGRPNNRLMVRIGDSSESREFELSGQDMTDKKFMFPMNITKPLDTVWNCVRECPRETISTSSGLHEQAEKYNNSLCISIDETSLRNHHVDFCPKLPVLKSVPIVNRCVPEDLLAFGQELATKIIAMDFVRGYLSEVVVAAPFILKMCIVAFVLSIISVYVLRFFAPVLVYFIYALVVLVSVGISAALWYSVYLISIKNEHEETSTAVTATTAQTASPKVAHLLKLSEGRIDAWLRMENTSQLTALGLAIGASVITVFVAFVVWCLLPRGQKMIRLFKKASMALAAMPILLLQPIATSIFIIIVAMYSISTCFLLYTAGEPVSRRVEDNGQTITVIETNMTQTTRMMLFYQLAGFIWLSEFVLACQRLFIAGAISLWYFDSRRRGSGRSSVCSSVKNMLRYHLGSAALGSFIITLVRLPRYVLMFIYAKMKAVENPVARKLLACFICILSCIERCLNYINYNAYTVIAYSGMSFCPSAKTAVNTLLDNAVDVTTLNTVGDAVLYLTKFIVSAITATIAAYQIQSLNLSHPWLPVTLVFFCSYLISNCFLSVYEMTLDTLFLCCAEDADLSKENPNNQYSNQEFKDLVPKSSRSKTSTSAESVPLNRM